MRDNWEECKLGDVLQLNVDSVDVLSQPEFRFAGVYCFGFGLFERGLVNGSDTSYKTYNRLHKNHIVISKVKGWEGAIALVTDEFEGAFLSPVYPTFSVISEKKTDIRFIHYFLKQKTIWTKLLNKSKGIGARRNSISEAQFLNLDIGIPPLAEQKRIVDKIESVQKKVEQIRKLRAEQEKEISNLLYNCFKKLIDKYGMTTLGSGLNYKKDFIIINDTDVYKLCRVQTKAQGVVLRENKIGSDIKTKKQKICKTDDFLVAEMDARFGGYGIVPPELNGAIVSSHYFLYSINNHVLNKTYLEFFIQTILFHSQVESKGSTNYAGIRPNQVLNYQIPLPPIADQNRIVSFFEKINQIRQIFKAQEAELTDLLPSLLDKAFKGELFIETKKIPIKKSNELESQYFVKRKMLGVYIINQSLNDEKFGDTKFEKIMHLAEYWAIKRNFNQQYYKKQAGPYDNRFIYNFYEQIEKSGWFDIQKKSNSQSKITAGKNNDKSQKDYGYFSAEELERVNILLNIFKKSDYKVPEVVSTLYAIWNNLIILQQEISDQILIQDFYDWDKHKAVYTKDQVEKSLRWMREKEIVPDGWGNVIERAKK